MSSSKFPLICVTLGVVLLIYIFASRPMGPRSLPEILPATSSVFSPDGLFLKWHACVNTNLAKHTQAKDFWQNFQGITRKCDSEAGIQNLPIVELRNSDETKYGLLPVKKTPEGGSSSSTSSNSDNILVTLGIGNDISAEKALKKKMTEIGEEIVFYGADPITDKNAILYSTIGTYFPFAIGADAGFSSASVLVKGAYVNQNVVYVDIVYFLDRMLKIKTYDHIWFDAEGAEYETFDLFYKGGPFDQNDISFCQMSLEVHNPTQDQKEQFMKFILQLLKDRRFGFFRNHNVGHMRMWLFNFESSYCRQKFLPNGLIV